MERVVLLDTCVLLDFMAGQGQGDVVENLLVEAQAAISVISVYELLRGVHNLKHLKQREELFRLCKIFDLTPSICRKAAEIYTHLKDRGELISHEDILIGATALKESCPLWTSNRKHFEKIPALRLYYPENP